VVSHRKVLVLWQFFNWWIRMTFDLKLGGSSLLSAVICCFLTEEISFHIVFSQPSPEVLGRLLISILFCLPSLHFSAECQTSLLARVWHAKHQHWQGEERRHATHVSMWKMSLNGNLLDHPFFRTFPTSSGAACRRIVRYRWTVREANRMLW